MLYELWLIGEWTLLLAGLVLVFLGYVLLLRRLTNKTAFIKEGLLFFLALTLLYLCIGSPFAQFSHFSFSLHMLQMSILYFVVPPMILLGIPYPLVQYLSFMKKINRLFPSPMTALILFALFFTIYHLPIVLNFTLQSEVLQKSYSFLLFVLSFSMWHPLTAPDPRARLRGKRLKRFAMKSGLLLMPACLLFIFHTFTSGNDHPFLSQITAQLCFPLEGSSINLLPPFFHSKTDQFFAGILMLLIHKFSIMMVLRVAHEAKPKLEFREMKKCVH